MILDVYSYFLNSYRQSLLLVPKIYRIINKFLREMYVIVIEISEECMNYPV
jgi:hypothetical protein